MFGHTQRNRVAACCLATCCGCCTAMVSSTALASPPVAVAPAALDAHDPAEEDTHRHLIGIKGVQVDEFSDGHTQGGAGAGVFFEESLIEGWLDLEASVVVEWVNGHTCAPFELLLKKPFHLTDDITPFVGLGPSLTVFEGHLDHETGHKQNPTAGFGLTFVAGTYVWANEHWGLDMEVDYNVIFDGPIHELTLALGPVYRF